MSNAINFPAWSIIYFLGAAQGVFLTLTLLGTRSAVPIANRYLMVTILVFSLVLFNEGLEAAGYDEKLRDYFIFTWPKEFFYGPCIYLYVRILSERGQQKTWRRDWLHFVPAMLHLAIVWATFVLPAEQRQAIFTEQGAALFPTWHFLLNDAENFLGAIHAGTYLVLCVIRLQRHHRYIRNKFSYEEKIGLNWLRYLLSATGSIYFLWVFVLFFSKQLGVESAAGHALTLAIVLLIYTMGFFGLRQPVIFAFQTTPSLEPIEEENESSTAPTKKYLKSTLSETAATQIAAELKTLMEQQQPHLNAALSLSELASGLGISQHHLSQVINEQLQLNFFDFVNGYRIQAATKFLTHAANTRANILTIAMDAGFNSKTAFYTAFRKHTGQTPSQYRRQALIVKAEAS